MAVSLMKQIELLLEGRDPLSAAEITACLAHESHAAVAAACSVLFAQSRLGRNGAGAPASPHKFFAKNKVNAKIKKR